MSEKQSKHNVKMDKRCPRGLTCHPDKFCPLAVQRLKSLRHAGRELTEDEENLLPGCKWAVNHQMANYCFFSLMKDYIPNRPFSDMEIAHFCNIAVNTVKKIEKDSMKKLKESVAFKEISQTYDGDTIFTEEDSDPEWNLNG